MKEEIKCGCGTGEKIGSQGGCGICSSVLMPKTFETGYDKEEKINEIKEFIQKVEKEFDRLFEAGGAPDIVPNIKQFISQEIDEALKSQREEVEEKLKDLKEIK